MIDNNVNDSLRTASLGKKDRFTSRQRKGYAFEKQRARDLSIACILPLNNRFDNIETWKKNQGKGPDFTISFFDKQIDIEAKHTLAKVFPCWISRDYLERFTSKSDIKVVVHNEGMKFPETSIKLLDEHGIIRVTQDKLIQSLLWIFLLSLKKHERKLRLLLPQLLLLMPYLIFFSCVTRLLNLIIGNIVYKFIEIVFGVFSKVKRVDQPIERTRVTWSSHFENL